MKKSISKIPSIENMNTKTAVNIKNYINSMALPKNHQKIFYDTLLHSEFIRKWLINNRKVMDDLSQKMKQKRTKRIIMDEIYSEKILTLNEKDFLKHLRISKMNEYTLIAIEDLTLRKNVEYITDHLSSFAAVMLEIAYIYSLHNAVNKYGIPKDRNGFEDKFTIIALGKLGGWELNFSSDIDIIFVYGDEKGKTSGINGKMIISNHEFFSKLSEKISHLLSYKTEDGFVFRVDLRLRPNGEKGAIALPLRSYEIYYESYGQHWEQMMLLKANPLVGDKSLGELFIKSIKPFVFKRHLDYKHIEDLVAIKNKITRRVALKNKGNNDVKLGYGGIREIEFIVQTIQILNYPRHPDVYEKNTLLALNKILHLKLMDNKDCTNLSSAYRFLRRVEHMIQIEYERQTHIIPKDSETFDLFLLRCGFENKKTFFDTYYKITKKVHLIFSNLLSSYKKTRTISIVDEDMPMEDYVDLLKDMGIRYPEKCAILLTNINKGEKNRIKSRDENKILGSLLVNIIKELKTEIDPVSAIKYFERILSNPYSLYIINDITKNSPIFIKKLINIFSMSAYLSNLIATNCNNLDYIYDPIKPFYFSYEIKQFYLDISSRINNIGNELDIIRKKHNEFIFSLGCSFINKTTDIIHFMKTYTELATGTILFVFEREYKLLVSTYGIPLKKNKEKSDYLIIGMGKIGSKEMLFGADLDLIVIYNENGITDGPKKISSHEFFSKLVQKITFFLATVTLDGFLFKIDFRLRPSGSSGTLVTSLKSFENYHRNESMLWEKQALLKSRVLNKNSSIAEMFDILKKKILFEAGISKDKIKEIFDMRLKIEKERGISLNKSNIKSGYGGVIDIEFLTQMFQLLYGYKYKILRTTNTYNILNELYTLKIISDRDYNVLNNSYIFYRTLENLIRVNNNTSTSILPKNVIDLEKIASFFMFDNDGADKLLNKYYLTRNTVRASFKRIFNQYIYK